MEISGSERSAGIEIAGIVPGATQAFNEILSRLFPGWTIEGDPSAGLRVSPGTEVRDPLVDDAIRETVADLRHQHAITISDVDRRPDGSIHLHAKIPGKRSIEEIRGLIVSPAWLEMKRVRYPPAVHDMAGWYPPEEREELFRLFGGRLPAGTELVAQHVTEEVSALWPVDSVPLIVGRDVADVSAKRDEFGDPTVAFRLTPEAGRRLRAATSQMVGRKMALILRDEAGARVVSAPVIEGVIASEGLIRGGFTESTANSLCGQLRAGSRAMPLRVIGLADEPTR